MRNLLNVCGMSVRVEALAFKLCAEDFEWGKDNRIILHTIRNKLAHFEDKLHKLRMSQPYLSLHFGI